MRFLSFLCVLGIVNAFYWGIKNQWMLEPATRHGGNWWMADAAVGVVCFIAGPMFWNVARARSYNRLAAMRHSYLQGEASEEALHRAAAEHDKEFG
jgi:hypothetical protein